MMNVKREKYGRDFRVLPMILTSVMSSVRLKFLAIAVVPQLGHMDVFVEVELILDCHGFYCCVCREVLKAICFSAFDFG